MAAEITTINLRARIMDKTINKLGKIFRDMVKNENSFGEGWKNLALGREAFELMQSLPDTYPGEFETLADKATLLSQMLDTMNETEIPRFCIAVREEIERLNPEDEDNKKEIRKLRDFIDLSLPMEEYCKIYRRHLKFDPVERTQKYEAVIADVEKEVAQKLRSTRRGMGFCFAYWSAKGEALAKRGIEWNSPALMNPGVMFD